jgi:hypothetical protein
MSRPLVRSSLVASAFSVALGVSAAQTAAQAPSSELATYRNERFGFSLSYPARRFSEQPSAADDDGRIFVSTDGNARLLVAALANVDGMSLADYRSYVIKQSYAGSNITFAPVHANWFIVSGLRDGLIFYERVTFTCGGRLINSWAMLYPAVERAVYDRIVELVARTYRPGEAGCD